MKNKSMIEIRTDQFNSVRPLFSTLSHNRSIVFSVLEGNSPGCVFVDDPVHPRAVFLNSITEFNFLAGDPCNKAFNLQVKSRLDTDLRPSSQYLLLFPANEPWREAIEAVWGSLLGEWASRLEYDYPPPPQQAPDHWQEAIPAGFTVQRYDSSLAASAPGLADFWFNVESFLAKGFGFAALHGDQPVSRCHTVVVGDNLAEISIDTEEAYRRKGLAQLVCRAFIEHSLEAGTRPHWSCWGNNTPSRELAKKLGFVVKEEAPVRVVILEKEDKDDSA